MHSLLFLEFIGTTELFVVLLIALIVFGPRKLPELGRSFGHALQQVRAASDDFKHTWEAESLKESETRPLPTPVEPTNVADSQAVTARSAGARARLERVSATETL